MPKVAARAERVPPSPIRKLRPLADAAQAAGRKIYHLNIGQPDIPTPEEFLEGYHHAPKVLAYSPSAGLPEAREALVRYYRGFDIEIDKEQAIITVGGSEAVVFALLTVADPGDQVLLPEPFYPPYNGYAEIAGVELVPITTRAETGYHLPPRAEIERRITAKTKAILLTNPGNPTGAVYSQEELETIKQLALEHDLFVISDEVYREFVYDGLRHTSILQIPELERHAILVDSFSKRFSACGARIGVFVSRNPEVLEAASRLAQTRLSPPTAGQLGLINYLNSPAYPAKTEAMIAEFRRRRDLLYTGLRAIPGVQCVKPQGAFYIMTGLPIDDSERFARWLLAKFSDDNETVMLAPGPGFYRTPGLGRNEVRIAYVLNTEALGRAIELLALGLEQYARIAQHVSA